MNRQTARRPCLQPGCTKTFVGSAAAKWGPCCRWKHQGRTLKKYVFTPERDSVIRERYDSRVRGRAAEIGRLLGWPTWIIKRRAAFLGLSHPRAAWQDWTPTEVAFLEQHAGQRLAAWMARKLRRSETSVVLKLKRMKLSRRIREGYTLSDLEQAFGHNHRVIQRWISMGYLRAARRFGGAKPNYVTDAWRFSDADVLAFVRAHPTQFRLDRVDQVWFLDLVFGGRLGERIA